MLKTWVRWVAWLAVLLLALGCDTARGLGSLAVTPPTPLPRASTPARRRPGPTTGRRALHDDSMVAVDEEERWLIGLFRRVNPSVVHVRVVRRRPGSVTIRPPRIVIGDRDFPGFHGTISDPDGGSGFVLDDAGHILTTNRVVLNGQDFEVTFADGTTAQAVLLGADPNTDLAVLQADRLPDGVEPLPFGNSDALRVGQRVLALGNPLGYGGSMSTGIVSAKSRNVRTEVRIGEGFFTAPDLIQTDALITPGTVGGPLVDLEGRLLGVLGIDTLLVDAGEGPAGGIGFVIPMTTVERVVPVLIREGRYPYPWLGISAQDLDPDLATAMGLPPDQRGVLIVDVARGSPAARARLRGSRRMVVIDGERTVVGGDVIVALQGQPVKGFDELVSLLFRQTRVGQTITLGVLRGGRTVNVQLTLAERP